MLKGQAGVEAAFIVAMIVTFMVTVAVPAVREAELDSVLSSCRLAGVEWASHDASRDFQGLAFDRQDRLILFKPQAFQNGVAVHSAELDSALLAAASQVANAPVDGNCVQALNYEYCV